MLLVAVMLTRESYFLTGGFIVQAYQFRMKNEISYMIIRKYSISAIKLNLNQSFMLLRAL